MPQLGMAKKVWDRSQMGTDQSGLESGPKVLVWGRYPVVGQVR